MISLESSIIRFKDVFKKYSPDNIIFSGIDLEIEKGEFVFLTGPSGVGKSTMLRILFCAERPTSGEIWVDGVALSSLSNAQVPYLRRKIGVIFQDFKLLSNRTIFDNVALSLEVIGLGKKQAEQRVMQVLEGVGLTGKMSHYPLRLSGGEQQRVAIARAVVNRPSIILADEPTGNLDLQRTEEVMMLMEELNARGATIIFATHDERLFENTHRRVLRCLNGKIRT
ncbi:MAG: cell division ATP-binding protein FtsE [Deltaproteobacteria bacterium]|nr:cell division ATP-binding protein FtsE [Deltaproteobacteria bacterium]MBW1933272.1 cell division ATP-binding protein FtsE [Deltaproteobacteria bacterium]MBW1937988.1 cell division ATP-binding protein FtsE [Deltaproteobacteria bacterium]MBW1965089.1 cell division ATP-binding protein FtsE [Deltaproteobacteria bacterium]MBW2079580.1 cell division ATP-binding protein FtsE [Deltaproteobacteria bacterium]